MTPKIAILIDGGYFLKRLPTVRPQVDASNPERVCAEIKRLITSHLRRENKVVRAAHARDLLYRAFYYDSRPYDKKNHYPISRRSIDFGKSPQAKFRLELFDGLRRTANMALRLGEVRIERGWVLAESAQKGLLKRERTVDDLTDDDFYMSFRQKGVDSRIAADISALTLKRQVGTIILVAGDSDFVPASKLARREGVKVVLDPLWRSVSPDLFEHIDGLASGFPRPGSTANVAAEIEA